VRTRLVRRLALLVAALLLIGAGGPEPIPEARELLGWVRSLADPALEGRASGTPGAERAARLIAQEFRRLGLRPGGDGGSYLQAFQVKGIRASEGSAIEATSDGTVRALQTANVIGMLPGTDPGLAHEAVVVGAHYDHLGRGSQFSLALERTDEIHPGADDNASGTAAVIGLARAFTAVGGARRSLVFVAFSGEELGLLGSTHYVEHPPIPLADTVAMVNLDSVGRMEGRRLFVLGVGSGTGLRALVEEAARGLDVELALREDAFGPADHIPFYSRGRPILFFFTGTHADYHRPTDTWEKVNAQGLRTVVAVAFRTIRALADRPERPAFVRLPDPPGPGLRP